MCVKPDIPNVLGTKCPHNAKNTEDIWLVSKWKCFEQKTVKVKSFLCITEVNFSFRCSVN